MKPEEQSELIIWDWLKTKGECVKEVYFNRKNELGWKTFTTSGVNKKPDFVVAIDREYGIEYLALEIKNTSSDRNILDAGKILDIYYENYIQNLTKYFIDNIEIKLKHFAVASENSPKGFLFMNETEVWDNSEAKNDAWRVSNAKYKLEPLKEYKDTSRFVRELWARFIRVRDKYKGQPLPSLGILMANFAENDFSPYYMTMIYTDWMLGKQRKWGARFWKL